MSVQLHPEPSQQSDANAGHHHRHTSPLDQQRHPFQHRAPIADLASTIASPHANANPQLAVFSANNAIHDSGEGPPAKRRKLSIRGRKSLQNQPNPQPQQRQPLQTTLDRFAFPQASPYKLVDKLAVAQPHGQLLDSAHGVHPTPITREHAPQKTPITGRKAEKEPNGTVIHPIENTGPEPIEDSKPREKPKPKPKTEDKRSLRSHDEGPRLKSELATYFPNYEDIIFDTTKEVEFIGIDTALYITDDTPKQNKSDNATPQKTQKPEKTSPLSMRRTSADSTTLPVTPSRTNSNQFNGSPILSFDFAAKTFPEKPEDPLSDEHYFKSHRRAERKEKQLRNIERERAMHEKLQLERLLDSLQGYDWLRVLGITGITDSEAKKFEPKRDFYISEVQALVDKFKEWREQEKKQRLDREAAAAAKEEDDDSLEGSVDPPSSDLNASAARQLLQETFNAMKSSSSKAPSKGKERANIPAGLTHTATPTRPMLPLVPPSPEIPITSFYDKRHMRDAALGKSRHGRNVTAFGHVVPEMTEADFTLPSDYVTEDALRANARERRRRKRDAVTASKAPKPTSKSVT